MQTENITLYGRCRDKVSTVLFSIGKVPSEKVSAYLSEKSICVRAGLHCAPLAHEALGTTDTGAVRVSISHFNTGEDIDLFLKEIRLMTK